MSLNFLDTKKIIIFSLLQYSTTMVLKSPKFYNYGHMKKQYKTTLYIHNPYKARRNVDYSYKDWEEKKPDIYDYLLPSTNQTSSTEYFNFTETSPKIMIDPEIITNPTLESSQYNTLFSSSATSPTLPSTVSTPDTSLPIPYTNSTPLFISPSLSTPNNTTTTTLIPEISNGNITTVTTTSSTVTVIDPVFKSIKGEIEGSKALLGGGYFTASIYILLKIIERKKGDDIKPLLVGLQVELSRLNSQHRLAMFGPMVISLFTILVSNLVTTPVELIQLQSRSFQVLLEHKRQGIQLETQIVFNVLDEIYTEEDIVYIVESLKDIQQFPNVPKHEVEVAKEAMEAFIFLPYTRIEGTQKEKLLLMQIKKIVGRRLAIGENEPMRRHYRKYVKYSREMKTSSENIIKYVGTKLTKAQIRKGFVGPTLFTEPTLISSSESDYTSFIKELKIRKRFGQKMTIYKHKLRQSTSTEGKFNTNRKLTRTTKSTSRYYDKISKFMDGYNFKRKKYLLSKDSSDNGGYFSYSEDDYYGTDANQPTEVKSTAPTKLKNNVIEDEEFKINIRDINKIRFDNKLQRSNSNEEAYLQVNLKDALFHTNNITIGRRFIKKKINKLRDVDSFSDDEAILKANIYKVFGYSNDFAKQLRTML